MANTDNKIIAEKQKPDKFIWGIFIALCIISIIETYSASSREIAKAGLYMPMIKHTAMLVAAAGIAYILQLMPYQRFIKFIPVFGILTLALLGYVELFGERINGAQRAINLPGFTLQPAEMAKLGVILFIAWFMAKNQMVEGVKNRGVVFSALIVSIFGLFLIKQGLTNTILLMSISMSMMIIGGVQWRKFFMVVCIYGAFGGIYLVYHNKEKEENENKPTTEQVASGTSFTYKAENRKGTWGNRIDRFLNPVPLYEQPINSINQQEIFSRMAQANGGIMGVFPGNSRECSRLPLAFSDYIYSIIVEDMGFIGGLFVLILYLWLFARAGVIASKCSRAFPALLVIGMSVLIVFQALFHMAINTGVFPVSGQPLPLISKGGTSIFITAMAFGIMLSVSRSAVQTNKTKEINKEKESLPENMQGANLSQIK
ncbi:MAG: FtsW/RodA/SpoVE family cell cycle protein [Muribaculaceae bacterium]|nr:FtsW/RodA/SpoVE family cell cycle protein [Muribaculaceae bacterium]